MDIVVVTIVLAAISALGTLAYKDPDGYKRLFKLVKEPITLVSHFSAGAFASAALIGLGGLEASDVMWIAAGAGLAAFAFSLTLLFFIWLRNDFARYGKDD